MVQQIKRATHETVYGSVRVLPQVIIFDCFSHSIGINGILILTGADHQAAVTDLVDHTGGPPAAFRTASTEFVSNTVWRLPAPSSLRRINFLPSSLLIPVMW